MRSAHIKVTSAEELAAVSVPFSDVESNTGKLQAIMKEYGYAVVTNVATPEECSVLEGLWGDDLNNIIDVDESHPHAQKKIMKDPVYNWPMDELPIGTKFASDFGLPQGTMAWAARSHPNVKRVYESLNNGEKELCCGTDNLFFNNRRAVKVAKDEDRENDLWPHIDQNIDLKPEGDWDVYQGVLYVWGVGMDCSTTVVWPGSHKNVEKTSVRKAKGHFVRLPDEMREDFVEGARRVLVPAGALLLWNSKTVHQGWSHGPRLAVPICFEPKSRRSEETLFNKKSIVVGGEVTTHWASLGVLHHIKNSTNFKRRNTSNGVVLVHRAHMHVFADPASETIKPEILSLL